MCAALRRAGQELTRLAKHRRGEAANRLGRGNYLLAYAAADGRTKATLTGVSAAGTIAFEFDYPTSMCGTVFIAQPIAFEALQLN